MSFEEAREYIRLLNLKSQKDYQKFIKSNPTPNDFPSKVDRVYKNNGWLSWGDFLGYSKGWNGKYREFKEARKFVRSLGIKSHSEWKKFCDSGKKPIDIPFSGYITYKDKGWINAADYFGHNRTSPQLKKYKTYKNAKAFVKKLNIKTTKEWQEYAVSGKKPNDIPSNPNNTYKKTGDWKGYGDWLGSNYIPTKTKSKARWSFEKARKHVRRMNFKTFAEYRSYVLSEDAPLGLPVNLHRAYKGKGWKGLDDFLGVDKNELRLAKYVSFVEAKLYARKLKLKNRKEWYHYIKTNGKPDNIPRGVDTIYKEDWKGWADFLGKEKT